MVLTSRGGILRSMRNLVELWAQEVRCFADRPHAANSKVKVGGVTRLNPSRQPLTSKGPANLPRQRGVPEVPHMKLSALHLFAVLKKRLANALPQECVVAKRKKKWETSRMKP